MIELFQMISIFADLIKCTPFDLRKETLLASSRISKKDLRELYRNKNYIEHPLASSKKS